MKLYFTTGRGAGVWSATQAEAATARKKLVSELSVARADVKTAAIDVPTKKAELVAFLNKCRAEL
ncbi:MAG: hypothetical protein DDT39_00033 [Firmicutes bacterium]|nr:hypothetical protein [candidate division NPL-UPA2 bacterium]